MVGGFGFLLLLLLAGSLAGLSMAQPTRYRVEAWSRGRGLGLTSANRPVVGYYLRTARLLRLIGAMAGTVLPGLVMLAYQGEKSALGTFSGVAWAYVGYLVGSLYAELSLARPTGGRRAASLAPRSLGDYLPLSHVWAQRGLAGAVVAGGAFASLLDPAPVVWVNGFGTGAGAIVVALMALTVAVVVETLERWIVRRPQPLTRPDLVAADDAIRSHSLHSFCGSALALLVLLASAQAAVLGQRDLAGLRRPLFAAAAFGLLASFAICMSFAHRTWQVHRPVASVS